jgi:hypothetical protein
MFESVTKAVLAHKQVVIAAVALSGLVAYMLPGNMFATAQNGQGPPPINIDTPGASVFVDPGEHVYIVTPGAIVNVFPGESVEVITRGGLVG